MAEPWLSDAEIDELCAPLRQPVAQVRLLRASGLTVTVKRLSPIGLSDAPPSAWRFAL